MSALRSGSFAASFGLLLAVLWANPAAASTPSEAVHGLDFFVHADLIQDGEGRDIEFWKQRLRRALAQATLALQGVQGQGADDPCCTRIEPADPEVELEVFGE
ncbi:MAG: hypothetical protein JRG96_20005, partial [Deltaproteobacteria bacterium]|nr:hypothetical protein [Deltaproteobacteria bacterium]